LPAEATSEKRKLTTTADLIRRGATLLNEACPKCGGVQIRYQGRVYCINEDDLSHIMAGGPTPSEVPSRAPPPIVYPVSGTVENKARVSTSPLSKAQVSTSGVVEREALRSLLEQKLAKVSKELENSQDFAQQDKLLDLISKYLETLSKLKGGEGRSNATTSS